MYADDTTVYCIGPNVDQVMADDTCLMKSDWLPISYFYKKNMYCFPCTKYTMEQRPNRYVNCFLKEFLLDLLVFLTNLISLDLDQRLAGTAYDTEVLLFGIL